MEQQYDDTFLARWLANELTAEELQEFKNSEDFEKYSQIVDTLETAELPNFDLDENFKATLDKLKLESQETKPKKRVIPLWSYAAAASIVIVLFVYQFVYNGGDSVYKTELAQKTSFDLPDGSSVNLNADSEVSFNKSNWSENRSLQLQGEAYFKVTKGASFTVNTEKGTVTVLGTQFTVNSRENLYQVICYEGKVLVVNQKQDSIYLTQGMAFTQQNGTKTTSSLKDTEPSWINDESSFKEAPIALVLDELERQFAITISGRENLQDSSFTGRFSHKDANLALQTVFMAMEIQYTRSADGNVVILKP